uniref:G-protein coupled receptors family 1 profile domain-containing protein n=1 Tax=Angiostrongylus cantonensis TaxID=6313 RepID=A0A0K0D3K5_ANGCA
MSFVAHRNVTKYNQISANVNMTTIALLPINCLCIAMSVLLFRTHRRNVTLYVEIFEPIFRKYLNPQINCQTSKFQIYNWYCVVVPVIMIQAVKQLRVDRRRKIGSILRKQVVGEEGTEYYFTLLKNQWQQSHESRPGQYEATALEETAS